MAKKGGIHVSQSIPEISPNEHKRLHFGYSMAKKGQLWDDSVLVKALDDAISKYKIMHEIGGDNGSLTEEKFAKGTEESALNVLDGSNEVKSSYVESDNYMTDVPKTTTQTVEPADPSVTEYANAESTKHYSDLFNQYNAVEEQRQNLLKQLYQYGNWDYQGYDYGPGYDSQYHSVSAPQTSEPLTCSCRPYVCPLTVNGNSVSLHDDGFIKAAMGAVDKAIKSYDKETSGIPDVVNQDKKKEHEVETTSQTDLSVVLNAWFSAGFYTGKYLSEQASSKK